MSSDLAYEALKDDGERFWLLSRELEVVETRNRVLTLVRRGGTAEAVAAMLEKEGKDIKPHHVRSIVKRHLERLHTEDALTIEQLRAQENARLDEAMRTLYPLIVREEGGPDMRAVDRFIRLSERRAKLNGLDAPARLDLGVGDSLKALGLDADVIKRATDAFATAFKEDEITDVEVVEDGPEDEAQHGPEQAGAEQEEGSQGRPQEPQRQLEAPKVEHAGARP